MEKFTTSIDGEPYGWSSQLKKWLPVIWGDEHVELPLTPKALKAALRKGRPGDVRNCFFAVALMACEKLGIVEVVVQKNYTFLRMARNPFTWVKQGNIQATKDFIAQFDKNSAILFDKSGTFTLQLRPVPPSDRPNRKGDSGTETRKNGRKKRTETVKRSPRSREQVAAEFHKAANG